MQHRPDERNNNARPAPRETEGERERVGRDYDSNARSAYFAARYVTNSPSIYFVNLLVLYSTRRLKERGTICTLALSRVERREIQRSTRREIYHVRTHARVIPCNVPRS